LGFRSLEADFQLFFDFREGFFLVPPGEEGRELLKEDFFAEAPFEKERDELDLRKEEAVHSGFGNFGKVLISS
jgi:hypothetical protein